MTDYELDALLRARLCEILRRLARRSKGGSSR